MIKFRTHGRIVELLRWKVEYTKTIIVSDENGNIKELEDKRTEYFPCEADADNCISRTGGTKSAIDVEPKYEWLDGLKVEDVPNTYKRAVEIAEMGEEAYKATLNAPTTDEYLVDLDYRLSMIELGL